MTNVTIVKKGGPPIINKNSATNLLCRLRRLLLYWDILERPGYSNASFRVERASFNPLKNWHFRNGVSFIWAFEVLPLKSLKSARTGLALDNLRFSIRVLIGSIPPTTPFGFFYFRQTILVVRDSYLVLILLGRDIYYTVCVNVIGTE